MYICIRSASDAAAKDEGLIAMEAAAEMRPRKRDVDCPQQSWRVFVQNRRIGVPSYVTGVDARASVGGALGTERRKRGPRKKLDSQFIISPQTPRLPSLFDLCRACGARTHTPVPSLQMHMWVHLSVVPLRAAPGS
jgi:hypothetical protein